MSAADGVGRQDAAAQAAVIADDLTSAADGGAPFVARGLRCRVARAGSVAALGNAPVGALDTGSRALPEAAAAAATAAAVAALRDRPLLLKTVDSTLRGHIGAEIRAAYAAAGRPALVFAPAFPAAGRTTRRGVQLVHGTAVDRSEYAEDPAHPVRSARLRDLLGGLDAGTDRLRILDAATQRELDRQVAAVEDPARVLWVGSPGLALALAARLSRTHLSVAPPAAAAAAASVLLLIGSANPASRRQCAALQAAGVALAETAAALPRNAPIVALCTPAERRPEPKAVRERLLREAIALLDREAYRALIVTGGETAEALLAALGSDGFELLGELEPGFVLGRAETERGPLSLALKAGGFGTPQTLYRAALRLRGAAAEQT